MKKLLIIVWVMLTVQLHAQVNNIAEGYDLSLNEVIYSKDSGEPNLFIFSMKPHGFVIVSALNEVLAYSYDNVFPISHTLPDHIVYWLDFYNNKTDYLRKHPWQIKEPLKSPTAVEPLLTSAWGQGCFHNEACPPDTLGPCGHVSAGCVAIAIAQIMYYHKQPAKGNGSNSYFCSPYGNLSANFGQTKYRWEEMTDTLHESNSAVATLVSHCGISVNMQYSAHQSAASNSDALDAFRYNFSYLSSTLLSRTDYTEEKWAAMIREDLDKHQPVYYAGSMDNGRHAFVCDGYDSNGLFHFNFGWDAVADGYYSLDSPYGFYNNQEIIRNIAPTSEIPIHSDEHGIIYVTPDGNGDGSSWAQATNDLRSAIFKSNLDLNTIWVKEGHYFGNPEDDYAFLLLQRTHLYGGFRGDEPFDYDLSQRDFEAHPTVLDGNHTQGVICTQTDPNGTAVIIIDGFTIQNGNAYAGGGILTDSRLLLNNCKLCLNHAQSYGGGIRCISPDKEVRFTNCIISNNTAKYGGGIACSGENNTFWNCLVSNNTATTGGGCHLKKDGDFFNCTIVKNEALDDYGGVYVKGNLKMQNCIVWGNTSEGAHTQISSTGSFLYNAIEGDLLGSELNFDASAENDGEVPTFYIRFKNPCPTAGSTGQGGDWRLQPNSLCVDMGKSVPNQPLTDLDGNLRLQHGNNDLGAYESNTVANVIDGYTCEDEPYYYNGTAFPYTGTYSFLYQGASCDSLVILHLFEETVISLVETICKDEIYDFFGTPLSESGHYSTTIDCITYDLDLTVRSESNTFHHWEAEICEGETYNFLGQILNQEGHYSTIIADCQIYELDLTVNPLPTVHCSNDTLIEFAHPFQLFAWGADTYLWSTGDTTQQITVYPVGDMTYSFTVTGFSEKGCCNTASVKVQVKTGQKEMVISPNPASDKVEIYMPNINEVEIYNLYGEQMDHRYVHHEICELDVSRYVSGIYTVHVRELNNHYYKKLVVTH